MANSDTKLSSTTSATSKSQSATNDDTSDIKIEFSTSSQVAKEQRQSPTERKTPPTQSSTATSPAASSERKADSPSSSDAPKAESKTLTADDDTSKSSASSSLAGDEKPPPASDTGSDQAKNMSEHHSSSPHAQLSGSQHSSDRQEHAKNYDQDPVVMQEEGRASEIPDDEPAEAAPEQRAVMSERANHLLRTVILLVLFTAVAVYCAITQTLI